MVEFRFPPPHPGRRSSSSGRAVPMTRSGASAHPVDEVVDEVEQVVVGPVQVLEDEHERPTFGQGLEEPSPGGEGFVETLGARIGFPREADQRPHVAFDPASALGIGDEVREHLTQLRLRGLCRIGLEDARPAP